MAEREVFDAVVVGSGATGGWAAKELTEAGLRSPCWRPGASSIPPRTTRSTSCPTRCRCAARRRRRALQDDQPIQKKCYQCDEYANHLFVNDNDCAYTTPTDPPVRLDPRPARGRQVDHVGPPELPPQRLRPEGREPRRLRCRLAARVRRVRALLRPRRAASSASAAWPRTSRSSPTASSCRRCRSTAARRWRARRSRRSSAARSPSAAPRSSPRRVGGRPPCHYCGPCGRGCTTGSYLLEPAQLAAGGRGHRPADAHPERGGEPHRARRRPALPERRLRRPHHARPARGVRQDGRPVRVHPREHAHHAELEVGPHPERPRERQRRPRPLPDGPHHGRRRPRRCRCSNKYVDDARAPAQRHLRAALPQHRRTKHDGFLRGYGFQGGAQPEKWGHAFAMPGFGAAFKKRGARRAAVDDELQRIRGVPAPLRELLPAGQAEGRRLGHPGPAHQHGPLGQRAHA